MACPARVSWRSSRLGRHTHHRAAHGLQRKRDPNLTWRIIIQSQRSAYRADLHSPPLSYQEHFARLRHIHRNYRTNYHIRTRTSQEDQSLPQRRWTGSHPTFECSFSGWTSSRSSRVFMVKTYPSHPTTSSASHQFLRQHFCNDRSNNNRCLPISSYHQGTSVWNFRRSGCGCSRSRSIFR